MHLAVTPPSGDHRKVAAGWPSPHPSAPFLINLAPKSGPASTSLSTDAYGTSYYLITGFHGLHVLGGLSS
jgi:hypothetical protein